MTSPASGGAHSGMATGMSLSTQRTDTNWLAGAVDDAVASQQTLKSAAESDPDTNASTAVPVSGLHAVQLHNTEPSTEKRLKASALSRVRSSSCTHRFH